MAAVLPAVQRGDRRLTTRFLGYERADTVVGTAWRMLGPVMLRCYLFAAIAVPAARAVQIALGSG